MEQNIQNFLDAEAQKNPVAPGEMPSFVHRLAIRSVPCRAGVMELHRRYDIESGEPDDTWVYRAVIEDGRPVTGESFVCEYSGRAKTREREQPCTIRLSDIEGANEGRRIRSAPVFLVTPISTAQEGLRSPIVEITVSEKRDDVAAIIHMRSRLHEPAPPTEFSWLMRVEFCYEAGEQADSH